MLLTGVIPTSVRTGHLGARALGPQQVASQNPPHLLGQDGEA